MENVQLGVFAAMRVAVGFLGEREQYAWWQSSFFSPQSRAFLAPVFGRTQLLAQTTGVTRAASLVHDERIGVGQVFHLFRLPEDLEEGIHQALQQPIVVERLTAITSHKDTALMHLQNQALPSSPAGVGPTRVGDLRSVRDIQAWRAVAAQYGHAFTTGDAVFPFFGDQS